MNSLQTCIADLEGINAFDSATKNESIVTRVLSRLKVINDLDQAEKAINDSPYFNQEGDPVNQPTHYNSHPSGIECIQITEHMNFNLGNAVKYIWRADLKNNATQDLQKAQWYIERELKKRTST